MIWFTIISILLFIIMATSIESILKIFLAFMGLIIGLGITILLSPLAIIILIFYGVFYLICNSLID